MNSRRDFFRKFLGHAQLAVKEAQGHRHLKLADLNKLSESQFKLLKVRIREGIHIRVDDQSGSACTEEGNWIHVFDRNTKEEMLFRSIQQRKTMAEMINLLEDDCAIPTTESYSLVRTWVLNLINNGICIPANHIHYRETEIED